MAKPYDDPEYFASRHRRTVHAARTVLGLLGPLVQGRRVLDLGCGVGTWCSVAREEGAVSVRGVDGPWVPQRFLELEDDEFTRCDLGDAFPDVDGAFDLVIWLENAEHLPQGRGEELLAWVAERTSAVLFSAAIPRQGGRGHHNERWQSYWAERYGAHGLLPVDIVRQRIWNDPDIPYWYKQNTILYMTPEVLERAGDGQSAVPAELACLDMVHPERWELEGRMRVGKALRAVGRAVWRWRW